MPEDHLQVLSTPWNKEVALVTIQGVLSSSTSDQFVSEMHRLRERGHRSFALDLRSLVELTSSGCAALVAELRAVEDQGGRVTVIKPSVAVRKLLDHLSVSAFLHITQTPEEAKEAHRVS